MTHRRSGAVLTVLLMTPLLAACGAPADPDGTLERVRDSGLLRVGVTESLGSDRWVDLSGEAPTGIEPALVERFATGQGAEVRWRKGSEQELVDGLVDGDLDIVVGGFTDDTPWSTEVAMTRPYLTAPDGRGGDERHVMLAVLGENALLLELERFLATVEENG